MNVSILLSLLDRATENSEVNLLGLARDYISHWILAGLVLVLSGFAPEYWIASFVHAIAALDDRFIAVFAGVTIIVCDTLFRGR